LSQPDIQLKLNYCQHEPLFKRQWYLTSDLMNHHSLARDADINAPEAWAITRGHPDVVVAVMDDGFDLGHPVFKDTRLHQITPDFSGNDNQPTPESGDYHGTPVASIAIGSHTGGAMRGIAPLCTFLPVRIGFGSHFPSFRLLNAFENVSRLADVVNCSFGFEPFPAQILAKGFMEDLSHIATSGGRKGNGLAIVFSAGNEDAPTFLKGKDNTHGIRFASEGGIVTISAGNDVFSGYPMVRGVITVAAMSSLKRKSGYSCWGPHVDITAPSDNWHAIQDSVGKGTPGRNDFLANYLGLGQVAASNRPFQGDNFGPLPDDPSTIIRENYYTDQFGGTSGAAPVVTGVVALMRSINPQLTSAQIRQILMNTADRDLDICLDLANDPNMQAGKFNGEFVDGHSLFFGAGKVNAFRAVNRARALALA